MKRSEINNAIEWAKRLLGEYKINLPDFGYWSLSEWNQYKEKLEVIQKTMLGWDIIDFGRRDFYNLGCVLFTLKNGDQKDSSIGTPYAEKLLMIKDGQRMPTHFHYTKTKDIINRGGGILEIELYNAKDDETIDFKNDIVVFVDGIKMSVKAGKAIEIAHGNSITLTPYIYHNFGAKKGSGDLIAGELSSVNDDNLDNHFANKIRRFAGIEEDVAATHPLCNEYSSLHKG